MPEQLRPTRPKRVRSAGSVPDDGANCGGRNRATEVERKRTERSEEQGCRGQGSTAPRPESSGRPATRLPRPKSVRDRGQGTSPFVFPRFRCGQRYRLIVLVLPSRRGLRRHLRVAVGSPDRAFSSWEANRWTKARLRPLTPVRSITPSQLLEYHAPRPQPSGSRKRGDASGPRSNGEGPCHPPIMTRPASACDRPIP